MINQLYHILSFFTSFFKKKEEVEIHSVSFPPSCFKNIREHEFINDYIPDVKVIDFVPLLNGKKVEFLERETYPIIPINKKIERNKILSNSENIYDFMSIELESIKKELDKTIYFELSEMGRKTALTLSKRKDNMPNFALSHQTTKDSIIYKIKFADNLLKDMNGIGVKNITISNSIFLKIKDNIKDGILEIHKKEVQVYLLPEHLDKEDELCLLLSSISKDSESPGLILTKTPVTVLSKFQDKTNSVRIMFSYGLGKCGTNYDFFYLRFFKT